MIDPIYFLILIILIAIFFAAVDRCKAQTIKEQERQIDDLWMVRDMRDTYISELQRRLERKQQPIIAVIPPTGQLLFDERHDICYIVPVYKN